MGEEQITKNYNWPVVSIQLPLFNEGKLVTDLLQYITQLDYPKEKMQIQVLDDSTDETSIIEGIG